MEAVIRPVAYIRSDFSEKFGIPRQSGLVDALPARIVFDAPGKQTLEPGESVEAVLKSALFSTLTVELKL